jgi:esterase/lipase superfamily enzyme
MSPSVPHLLPPRSRLASLLLLGLACAGLGSVSAATVEAEAVPVAAAAETLAGETAGGPLDLWVASTRRLPAICRPPTAAALAIERLSAAPCGGRWERAELADLLAEPGRPLVIFVHGNRYEPADAKVQGLRLARRLAAHAPGEVLPRVVIFSWPSQQQGLLLKDGRRKLERACADGHYLAWLLARLEPERPLALVGYSFGALVAAEALDDVSRSSSAGIPWAERPGRTNVVFVAPAVRQDAVAPRGLYRGALAGVDRFTLLINSRDEALRFFPLLEPAVRMDALGYVGFPVGWLPAGIEYAASDAAAIVGKEHSMRRYLDSRSLAERIATGALAGLDAEATLSRGSP